MGVEGLLLVCGCRIPSDDPDDHCGHGQPLFPGCMDCDNVRIARIHE